MNSSVIGGVHVISSAGDRPLATGEQGPKEGGHLDRLLDRLEPHTSAEEEVSHMPRQEESHEARTVHGDQPEEDSNPQQYIQHDVLNEITEHIDTLVHLSQSDDTLKDYCVKFQLEHAAANAAYSLQMESCGQKRITPPRGLVDSHMKGALERMAEFCGSVSRHVLARTLELSSNANTAKLMGVSPNGSTTSTMSGTHNQPHGTSPLEQFNSDSMPTSQTNASSPPGTSNLSNLAEKAGLPSGTNFIVAGGIEQYPEGSGNPYTHPSPSNSHGNFPESSGDSLPGASSLGMSLRSGSVEDVTEGTLAWIEVGANALHAAVNSLNLLTRAHGKLDGQVKSHMMNNSNIKVLEYVVDALAISREVEMHCFAEGYRTMHISLMANLTHDSPEVCRVAGTSAKILSTVLTCTRLDEENPGCAEWAEYTIRNLCMHSPEARDFIKHLKLSLKSPGAAIAAASLGQQSSSSSSSSAPAK